MGTEGVAGVLWRDKVPSRWTLALDVVLIGLVGLAVFAVVRDLAQQATLWGWCSLGLAIVGLVGWVVILRSHLAQRRRGPGRTCG